jgi:hypothetical protein
MVLAGRYRIIGLIGRGGMGEVYRADDLKLGQPVALKFLPKALADDAVRRERLFAEVRIARQVSHPNICRVYDISELEGRHFLTMEYIDGEDLASLLKRIGNLHGAKALDVARQLCAGLAAAHDKGVLHRDLKPANVMIDGRGHVRITDFGLAVAAGEDVAEGDVSGTPPYMAPEQFAGKGASVRSDIYALGLVFYEVFTGRRAFESKTLAELRAKKESASPTAPSEIARDIDPIVERVILRCIEKDPRQRPASAAQVASALPGGDPLAAAIAAGETPSPEMVAASGSTEGIRPWIAWACLAFIILGIGVVVMLGRHASLIQRVPLNKPPDVMAERARDILQNAGYPDPPADSAYRFVPNQAYLQHVEKTDRLPARFNKLPAMTIQFWYRQSPQPLIHLDTNLGISLTDPPVTVKGESVVWLDSLGNLIGLRVIPPEKRTTSGAIQPADWSVLFKAAGLDPARYTSVEPEWTPPDYADTRAAWTGVLPDRPDVPIRIEAAAWQGKPISWRLIVPSWENLTISAVYSPQTPDLGFTIIIGILLVVMLAGPAFFARRNLRLGRGDRRGAARLVCFISVCVGIRWIFGEHHVGTLDEFDLFVRGAASYWFLVAGLSWLLYIALEPFVRRRWPGILVGWSRLLAGSYRDPLVGRDLLAGCAVAVVAVLLNRLRFPVSLFLGSPQPSPLGSGPNQMHNFLSGASTLFSSVLGAMITSILISLILSFILFLLRILLRNTWAATIVFLLIATCLNALSGAPLIQIIISSLILGTMWFLLLRFGLLALAAGYLFNQLLNSFPITMKLSAWYSGIGLAGLALLLAFALYAFHSSLGGQPLFGRASLED